jgi:hypothetical protein
MIGVRILNNKSDELFSMQYSILRDFLIHYSSFRELHKRYDSLVKLGTHEFWVYTINSHFLQAINLWCMVFGSYSSNATHWKNMALENDFKPVILEKLDLQSSQYDTYWSEVTSWRNKYSVHRETGFLKETPDLKLARSIVILYVDWVGNEIEAGNSFSLELLEKNFIIDINETMDRMTGNL